MIYFYKVQMTINDGTSQTERLGSGFLETDRMILTMEDVEDAKKVIFRDMKAEYKNSSEHMIVDIKRV